MAEVLSFTSKSLINDKAKVKQHKLKCHAFTNALAVSYNFLSTDMKINWTSLFGNKKSSTDRPQTNMDEIEYDKYADFYYTNLINSLILFSLTATELEKLAGPVFNPLTELETEIDYAFTPVLFDTIFRNGLIDKSYKSELLSFKKLTDDIPSEIWDFESIDKHETWISTRQMANSLLDRLGVTNRTYNDDYTTVYDNEGKILKKGKNCS